MKVMKLFILVTFISCFRVFQKKTINKRINQKDIMTGDSYEAKTRQH